MARSTTLHRPPRLERALASVRELHQQCRAAPTLARPRGETEERLLARFERLIEHMAAMSSDYEHVGRDLLCQLQSQHPELWPLVDRRLLWFFGGDCLHFLGDEEIDAFQAEEDALGDRRFS